MTFVRIDGFFFEKIAKTKETLSVELSSESYSVPDAISMFVRPPITFVCIVKETPWKWLFRCVNHLAGAIKSLLSPKDEANEWPTHSTRKKALW